MIMAITNRKLRKRLRIRVSRQENLLKSIMLFRERNLKKGKNHFTLNHVSYSYSELASLGMLLLSTDCVN